MLQEDDKGTSFSMPIVHPSNGPLRVTYLFRGPAVWTTGGTAFDRFYLKLLNDGNDHVSAFLFTGGSNRNMVPPTHGCCHNLRIVDENKPGNRRPGLGRADRTQCDRLRTTGIDATGACVQHDNGGGWRRV